MQAIIFCECTYKHKLRLFINSKSSKLHLILCEMMFKAIVGLLAVAILSPHALARSLSGPHVLSTDVKQQPAARGESLSAASLSGRRLLQDPDPTEGEPDTTVVVLVAVEAPAPESETVVAAVNTVVEGVENVTDAITDTIEQLGR
jgi:hypothetical protein